MSNDTLEQAVVNILTQRGYVRDSELLENLDFIKPDFNTAGQQLSLPTMFKSINTKLRKFSMEIKSIHLTNSNNDRVTYHGIVNTEEDFVSKEYGSPFEPAELKFFTQIVNKLLEEKYLSTDDIADLRPLDKMSRDKCAAFVAKLEAMGWLRRDDSNYLILGVRTHLELRSYLEGVIMDSGGEAEEGAREAERVAQLRSIVAELPQIIVY